MSKQKNKNGSALPPSNTTRWVKSRKIAVLNAIDSNVLTEDDACKRYSLSQEELQSWRRLKENHGADALRTTHLKRYRSLELKEQGFHISESYRNPSYTH